MLLTKKELEIVNALVAEKIARNEFQAAHILNGLKLTSLKSDEVMPRARIYRDWRNSGIYPKADTASCYAKAIAGERVPVDSMFDGALLSEAVK